MDDINLDWDQANIQHIAKHKISQLEVEQVLKNDPMDMKFEIVEGEDRWTSVGHTDRGRVLLVVWTIRSEACRVVTAWPAGFEIKSAYLKGVKQKHA